MSSNELLIRNGSSITSKNPHAFASIVVGFNEAIIPDSIHLLEHTVSFAKKNKVHVNEFTKIPKKEVASAF